MMSNPLPFSLLYILVPLVLLICAGALGYAINALRRLPPTATSYSAVALDPADPPIPPAPIPPPPESWAMKNTDKLLIACLMVFSVIVTLVAIGKDPAQVQFFNGLTNTLSGCLITLVVGPVLRKTTETVTKDPEGRPMGIVSVKTEEK